MILVRLHLKSFAPFPLIFSSNCNCWIDRKKGDLNPIHFIPQSSVLDTGPHIPFILCLIRLENATIETDDRRLHKQIPLKILLLCQSISWIYSSISDLDIISTSNSIFVIISVFLLCLAIMLVKNTYFIIICVYVHIFTISCQFSC